MAYDENANHYYKDKVRTAIFRDIDKPLNSYFTLCSATCADIEHLLSRGLIIPGKTKIMIVEYVYETIEKIHAKMKSLGFSINEYHIFHGDLLSKSMISNVIDWERKNGFDFMYFDFCGEVTKDVVDFVLSIKDIIKRGNVAFTFSCVDRNNKYYENSKKNIVLMVPKHILDLDSELTESISHYGTFLKAKWSIDKIFDALYNTRYGKKATKKDILESMNHVGECLLYKEVGSCVPMMSFRVDGNLSRGSYGRWMSPARRAWVTMRRKGSK